MTNPTDKPLRCRLGFHKFTKRAVHITEPYGKDDTVFTGVVIEYCNCGESRFAMGGREMPTAIVLPEKYRKKE